MTRCGWLKHSVLGNETQPLDCWFAQALCIAGTQSIPATVAAQKTVKSKCLGFSYLCSFSKTLWRTGLCEINWCVSGLAEGSLMGKVTLRRHFIFSIYIVVSCFGSFAFFSFRLLILYFLIHAFTALCPIVCLKEMQKLPEAVQLIEKASMMYLENGTPDTAAMALERAGKWVWTGAPPGSLFDKVGWKQVFSFSYKSDILVSFRLIENVDPEKAVQLYQQTANVFEVSEFVFSK